MYRYPSSMSVLYFAFLWSEKDISLTDWDERSTYWAITEIKQTLCSELVSQISTVSPVYENDFPRCGIKN